MNKCLQCVWRKNNQCSLKHKNINYFNLNYFTLCHYFLEDYEIRMLYKRLYS